MLLRYRERLRAYSPSLLLLHHRGSPNAAYFPFLWYHSITATIPGPRFQVFLIFFSSSSSTSSPPPFFLLPLLLPPSSSSPSLSSIVPWYMSVCCVSAYTVCHVSTDTSTLTEPIPVQPSTSMDLISKILFLTWYF